MREITVNVQGDRIEPALIHAGTRGSYGVTDLNFSFSHEWDGLTKKVVFFPLRGTPVYGIYTHGTMRIPAKVMKYDGTALMIISGYTVRRDGKIDRKVITASCEIFVEAVPSDLLYEPDIPDATVFEEIVEKLGAPYIGPEGTWWIWDTETHGFFDTGLPSRGIQGEPGRGLTVLGHYATEEELRTNVTDPAYGDAYSVGDFLPYEIFIFDEVTNDWVSHGVFTVNGVADVQQITQVIGSDAPNIIRFVLDDGGYYDIVVRNGGRGDPGNIHIGSDTPPDDAYIWIDPYGDASNVLRVRVGDTFVAVPAVRGEKGDPGKDFTFADFTADQLAALKGDSGYTPQRGTDYWTPSDIASMQAYIDEKILNGEW